MDTELVVIQPFGDRQKGAVITDPAEMQAALEQSPHCLVRRVRAEEVKAEAEADKS